MLKTAFFKRSYIAVQIFCILINLEWLSGIKWCAALSKQTLFVCMYVVWYETMWVGMI